MTSAADRRDRHLHRGLLALLLLSALTLRAFYAVHEPHLERFEDEKYALRNVVGIALHGSFVPRSVYYPSPVFTLPPAALVAAANTLSRSIGDRRLLAIDEQGHSLPMALWLCRLLMAVYGTLALWVLYLIGRRMFDARVGLLAAGVLAFMPWSIHSSGSFKPDPLLVLTVLAAFYASLRAVDGRRAAPYLLAGVAIALAASSKLTGLLVALPLTVATMISWRDLRRWLLLLAAGATSLVTFVLLNPYWLAYPRFIAGLRADYAKRAGWQGMTREEMPGRVLDLILGQSTQGPILGGLALLGLLALIGLACRRATPGARRTGLVMMLVFPPAYVAAYTQQTAYFKANNFLPILPFTALAAAWLLAAVWDLAARRWPPLSTPRARRPAVAVIAILLVFPGFRFVYGSLLPSTEDMAHLLLRRRLAPPTGRSIVVEPAARRGSIWEDAVRARAAPIAVQRLDELPPAALDLADAELFAESRLRSRGKRFYQARIDRLPPDQVHRFRPRLFRLRGPALVALVHRRTRLGEPVELALERCAAAPTCFEARLPAEMLPRERFSLELRLRRLVASPSGSLPPLEVGARSVPLLEMDRSTHHLLAGTARLFVDDPRNTLIRFTARSISPGPPVLRLLRWAGGPRTAPPVAGSRQKRDG